MSEIETRFEDGNVSDVVQVGDTVRRMSGPWTLAVHALLGHLDTVGFQGAPRALGFDNRDREILTFIPGTTVPASLDGFRSDSLLIETARLLRRYHDATATFVPPPNAAWRFQPGAPGDGDVICHNDIAPWNTVMVDEHPIAFIDWDFAAPGPRIWDIAYALWRFVPLYDQEQCGEDESFRSPAERARRMVIFCNAYDLGDRRELLATIERRQVTMYESLKKWAEGGIPAFVTMWREGHADGVLRDRAYLRRHWVELQQRLGV